MHNILQHYKILSAILITLYFPTYDMYEYKEIKIIVIIAKFILSFQGKHSTSALEVP